MTASTLVIVLACELVARVALWRSALQQEPEQKVFGFSATGYGDLRPNMSHVETLYDLRPYFLQTNSVGLRNSEELVEGAFRVLAIGDSFTYGYYVHNQETWPARLEEVLNQRLTTRVQVLNAGVPGYTIEDELAYLRDKGLALEPDLVILGVYTNDIMDMNPRIRQHFARPVLLAQSAPVAETITPLEAFLQNHTALYSLLVSARGAYRQQQIEAAVNRVTPTIEGLRELYLNLTFLQPDAPEYRTEWEAYERLLRETAALLEDAGIPFVIVMFPDLAQMPEEGGLPEVPQQRLGQMADEMGTPFLDLLPVFRGAGDIQSLYLMYYSDSAPVDPNAPDAAVMMYTGDGHPSPYGHLVAARAAAQLLAEQKLTPFDEQASRSGPG
jgi:lysophospholipase L1-like esterase